MNAIGIGTTTIFMMLTLVHLDIWCQALDQPACIVTDGNVGGYILENESYAAFSKLEVKNISNGQMVTTDDSGFFEILGFGGDTLVFFFGC